MDLFKFLDNSNSVQPDFPQPSRDESGEQIQHGYEINEQRGIFENTDTKTMSLDSPGDGDDE